MIRLDLLILADAATLGEGKLNVLGGAITRLTPPNIPTVVNLAVAVRLLLDAPEDFAQLDHRLEIVYPSGGVFAAIPFSGEGASPPMPLLAGESLGVVFIVNLSGFPVTEEGLHTFRVCTSSGESLGETRMVVARLTG
jgi:hypothetical protein